MKSYLLCMPVSIVCVLLVLLTGCAMSATETSMPEPTSTPGPTSCEEVEGICMKLLFDGEKNCVYNGPANLNTGPVTLIFLNESESLAAVNVMRHTGDETIQDMIDYLGEEPSTKHHPQWSEEVGTWKIISSGKNHIWKGTLEPGIHTMVCASPKFGGWYGGGFTVEE